MSNECVCVCIWILFIQSPANRRGLYCRLVPSLWSLSPPPPSLPLLHSTCCTIFSFFALLILYVTLYGLRVCGVRALTSFILNLTLPIIKWNPNIHRMQSCTHASEWMNEQTDRLVSWTNSEKEKRIIINPYMQPGNSDDADDDDRRLYVHIKIHQHKNCRRFVL